MDGTQYRRDTATGLYATRDALPSDAVPGGVWGWRRTHSPVVMPYSGTPAAAALRAGEEVIEPMLIKEV